MTTDKPLTDGQLAKELKRSRRWIYDARARGAPAGTTLAEWLTWTEQNDTRKPHSAHGMSLKDRKTRQEIRKLRLQNDIRDARNRALWEEAGFAVAMASQHRARQALYGILPDRLASALACDVVLVRKEIEKLLEEIFPKAPGA